jgi:hypothetical protein
MFNLTDSSVFTAIGAVLAAVSVGALLRFAKMAFDAIRDQRIEHSQAIKDQRDSFQTFLGNHMSTDRKAIEANTAGLTAVSVSLQHLADEVAELRSMVKP